MRYRIQASAAKYMRDARLWVITERVVFGFLTLEDGTDMLSRNVDEELPLHAA
jgi:hypothetical protein